MKAISLWETISLRVRGFWKLMLDTAKVTTKKAKLPMPSISKIRPFPQTFLKQSFLFCSLPCLGMSHRVIAITEKVTSLILRENLENALSALQASYKSWAKLLLQMTQEVAFKYLTKEQ